MSSVRLAREIQYDSVVDGAGLRMVIWTQGCPHHCKNCHNPQTWDFDGGFIKDTAKLIEDLKKGFYHDGLTLSGGEPLHQPKPLLEIVRAAKAMGLNVWCYTGYVYENISDPDQLALIREVDVLVDGPFIEDLKSMDALYRGSTNQRLIDIPKTIKAGKVILWHE